MRPPPKVAMSSAGGRTFGGEWPCRIRIQKAALRGLDVALWLSAFTLEIRPLELNGARSNPQAGVELSRLGELHDELLRRASVDPREPRPVPAKVSPVLETVTLVLERAGEPMRARDAADEDDPLRR